VGGRREKPGSRHRERHTEKGGGYLLALLKAAAHKERNSRRRTILACTQAAANKDRECRRRIESVGGG
jgi:hypothetical protein